MKTTPYERNLKRYAIISRFILVFIQYLSNHLLEDHNANVFTSPVSTKFTSNNRTFLDKLIHHFLGGFLRWDAQYFLNIAYDGYSYENVLAFFPFYPIFARSISICLFAVSFDFLHFESILLVVLISINCVFFVLTIQVLYELTIVFFDAKFAYKTCLLFCFSPASIFFVAPYTECLFSYFTFKSMLICLKLYKKRASGRSEWSDLVLLAPICCSVLVRSNGALNIGFMVYAFICLYLKNFKHKNLHVKVKGLVIYVITVTLLATLCLLPLISFAAFSYYKFCTNYTSEHDVELKEYALENNLVLPGQFAKYNQSWCYEKFPLAYNYVQSHYWNVGLFKYYELKQLPNFLLALPILLIILISGTKYLIKKTTPILITLLHHISNESSFLQLSIVVFVLHALFLTIFCICFVHIQVSTRMLASATPFFYWASASYIETDKFNSLSQFWDCTKGKVAERLVKMYYLAYFVVGTVLFSNFYPWT